MRNFVSTALVATVLAATASAQVVIPAGTGSVNGGNSGSTSFNITATIDDSCYMTKPSDVLASQAGSLFWTQQAATPVDNATSFVIACNSGAVYSVALTSGNIVLTRSGGTETYTVQALLDNGTNQAVSFTNVTFPTVPGSVTQAAPQTTSYTVDLVFPIPSQSLPAGDYSGTTTITLVVN